MSPRREQGPGVEVREDGDQVLVALDHEHAAELARIISSAAIERPGHDSWLQLAHDSSEDTWMGAMLRLLACSQRLRPGPVPQTHWV